MCDSCIIVVDQISNCLCRKNCGMMLEAGVYSRLSAAPFQGSCLVRKETSSDYVIQIGGIASKKDQNHPLSHYLQLRMFHVPTAKWLPQSVVSNGYFNRSYHAAVAIDDDIFIFGGENVGHRNIFPPLLNFQHAESDILKISKGFFGYKTTLVTLETEINVSQLGLVGHSATVVNFGGNNYVIIYGGFEPNASGNYKFNSNIYIFSIEDAADYHAAKRAFAGGGGDVNHNSKPEDKVYVLRTLEADPSHPAPLPRSFHSATLFPSSSSDSQTSCKILIHGGLAEHSSTVFDDGWLLDLTEYLTFLQHEALERKKAAENPVAAPAPTGKDAKKDAKKDNKKDAAAPPPRPAFPYVQWKEISFSTESESSHADETATEEKGPVESVNLKRWDHTLSIWPTPSADQSVTTYHILITGGHGSAMATEQVIDISEQQLRFALTYDHHNHHATMVHNVHSKNDTFFRLSSQEFPALWGSRSTSIIPKHVLSRGNGNDDSELSLCVDDEGVAVLVFGGFHAEEEKTGWPSRPGSPSNVNPSGMNHHLFDLSATIAASKTVTTIVSPDLLATASHIQQNPKKTLQLHVAGQDMLDRTYVLISADEPTDDSSLTASETKRLKQRNLARDYLRRIMRGEDPDRVKADILDQLRRANMEIAAVSFEHRRIVYPQTGNVYEGLVVPVASLINVAREAGDVEPVVDNEFEGVVPHGKGKMSYSQTGNVYDGEWRHGRQHGDGIFEDAIHETRYTGRFVENVQEGQGRTVDTNKGENSRWEHSGEYRNNVFEGIGKFKDVGQGLEYVGDFKNGLKDGKGKVVLADDPDKLVCEGTWSKDVMVGEGVAYALPIISLNIIKGHLPNSVVLNIFFELSIQSALRPPAWLAVKEDRKTLLIAGDYSGKLLDGKPNDELGSAIYSDGSVCRATWKMGRRNGHGVYVFGPDRTQYEGKWVGDRRCGYGTWRTPTNRVLYDGLWSENVYHGTGRLIDYDVDVVYEGQFRLGFKEGQGLVRPRGSDEDELQRIAENKTKTLAGAAASPLEVLDRSQWIHDHTVLLPPEQPAQRRDGEGSVFGGDTYMNASYPPSPGSAGMSPNSRSAFNSPTMSRAGRR